MVVEYDDIQQKSTLFLFRQLYTLDCRDKISFDEKLKLNRLILRLYKFLEYSDSHQIFQRVERFSFFLKDNNLSVKENPLPSDSLFCWL
jgi:hypothetical protein